MSNQNITQLPVQTGSAVSDSLFYAVTAGGTTDTGLPLSVLFNSPTFTGTPVVPGYLTSALAASTYLAISDAASTYLTQSNAASTYATQASTALLAPLASPALTGTPTAPTPSNATNNTQIATMAALRNMFAQPAPLGNTTPNSGVFTTLKGNSLAKVQANNVSAQSIANSTNTVITNWTETLDANNNFNNTTGVFTAPTAGQYLVSAQAFFVAANWAANSVAIINILQNGTAKATFSNSFFSAVTGQNVTTPLGTFMLNCAASDTISIQVFQSSGGAVALYSADANHTILSICQVP